MLSTFHLDSRSSGEDFIFSLAHELRTPLAAVLSATQLLHHIDCHDDIAAAARDVIERQARHMARLIEDVLDVCRITHGKLVVQQQSVDLAQAVAAAVESVTPLVRARDQQLTIGIPRERLLLAGETPRVHQVLVNLLTNAAKYTEAGGQIHLSAEAGGDMVILRVRDSGIGISPEMLPRVFDLYAQATHATMTAPGGLGIGLALVRLLVEAFGGSVSAYSAGLGQGSEFVVRWPAVSSLSPQV